MSANKPNTSTKGRKPRKRASKKAAKKKPRALNDKQRKAIQAVAGGASHEEAAKKAGYASKQSVQKMMSNDVAQDYLKELRKEIEAESQKGAILSRQERMEFLSRGVISPLGDVDEKSDLCTEKTITRYGKKGDEREVIRIKKVDPLRCIDLLNRMDGDYAPEKVEHSGGIKNELELSDEAKAELERINKISAKIKPPDYKGDGDDST